MSPLFLSLGRDAEFLSSEFVLSSGNAGVHGWHQHLNTEDVWEQHFRQRN